MIELSEFAPLLDLPLNHVKVIEMRNRFQNFEEKRFANVVYLCAKDIGVELCFAPISGSEVLVLKTIILSANSNENASFLGQLPGKTKFGQSLQEVEGLLGKPTKSGHHYYLPEVPFLVGGVDKAGHREQWIQYTERFYNLRFTFDCSNHLYDVSLSAQK